jgi:zinc transporter ZupT
LNLSTEALEAVAVPLVAGAFTYIAAAELVPELHHHSKGRDAAIIVAGLLAGLTRMALLLQLEMLLPGLQ